MFFSQANETGGSNQMELEGAKRCFAFLKTAGVPINTFVSDRHSGIAKWMREHQQDTKHYSDIWHLARSVAKKMLKASKVKGCEIILHWIKGVRNHLYWCATSTKQGFGDMIFAKWYSFLRHVQDKHEGHSNNYFPKCAHDELDARRPWIKNGKLQHKKTLSIIAISKYYLNTFRDSSI